MVSAVLREPGASLAAATAVLYFVFLIVCTAVFFVGTFNVELDMSKLVLGITVGGQALGPSLSFARVMSLPINITATLLLFGAAAWSVWRFARRCSPFPGRAPVWGPRLGCTRQRWSRRP